MAKKSKKAKAKPRKTMTKNGRIKNLQQQIDELVIRVEALEQQTNPHNDSPATSSTDV
jgi:hypothetical protein